ncbi:MAG TPA: 4-alpha-glucanotransferase [Sporichthya sp.]|nr:4-alpha-glucanotransferase [Sporichthya sp.]
MTDPFGIDRRYTDAGGTEREISPEVVEVLRGRIGTPPAERPASPLVCRPGGEVPAGSVQLEDGGTVDVDGALPPDLPFGYHRLTERDGAERRLIVGPGRAHLPENLREWGWAVQLYAARSRRSWGMGDYADLGRLTRWSAGLGAGFVLVNPLNAVAPRVPQQPSPYYPASRRFRSPLYLAVEDVPGAADVPEVADAAAAGRALNTRREIDRDKVWELKVRALDALWGRRDPGDGFEEWVRGADKSLQEFATWCALAEEHGGGWRSWPAEFQRPGDPAVAQFADEHADRIRFHCWLQYLTQGQLDAATGGLRAIQDLPIGVDPQGADAWAWQELLAPEVSVGAPPDEFNSRGQDWGLPPFVPWRLVDAGYEPFAQTVRASMVAGGGLRVDHVMGLFRLWWVPAGAPASDGGYVRYPAEDLLDIVALESVRAGALVVGEDLGTVEPGVREAMAEHNVLSYRLLWFEQDDPATWPRTAMAAVTTHDLPTVAGLWSGADLELQHKLELEPNVEGTEEMRDRLAKDGGLPDDASDEDAVEAAYTLLARAPSVLLTASLDDAVAEPERPNIPGADGRRPNWSLALPVPLDDVLADGDVGRLAQEVATVLTAAVGSSAGDRAG